MMRHSFAPLLAPLALLPVAARAQTFHTADTVIRRMWQVLIDSIGPRLSGSPGFQSAVDWIERTYNGWGVPVRRERYGTWRGWRQGTVHMEMIAPRMQNLEVHL